LLALAKDNINDKFSPKQKTLNR